MTAGIIVWAYTLLLPSILDSGMIGEGILSGGPFGLGWLRPQALFGLDLPPLVHGVVLSLVANVAVFIGGSLARQPSAIERVQADVFVPSSLAPIAPSFRTPPPPWTNTNQSQARSTEGFRTRLGTMGLGVPPFLPPYP